jgi:hypothetical protein
MSKFGFDVEHEKKSFSDSMSKFGFDVEQVHYYYVDNLGRNCYEYYEEQIEEQIE